MRRIQEDRSICSAIEREMAIAIQSIAPLSRGGYSLPVAPMYPAIPGVRSSARLGEKQDLLVDWSNLPDKNYRGISRGIDGPGRSLSIQYKVRF
jgi:hypothetical protein